MADQAKMNTKVISWIAEYLSAYHHYDAIAGLNPKDYTNLTPESLLRLKLVTLRHLLDRELYGDACEYFGDYLPESPARDETTIMMHQQKLGVVAVLRFLQTNEVADLIGVEGMMDKYLPETGSVGERPATNLSATSFQAMRAQIKLHVLDPLKKSKDKKYASLKDKKFKDWVKQFSAATVQADALHFLDSIEAQLPTPFLETLLADVEEFRYQIPKELLQKAANLDPVAFDSVVSGASDPVASEIKRQHEKTKAAATPSRNARLNLTPARGMATKTAPVAKPVAKGKEAAADFDDIEEASDSGASERPVIRKKAAKKGAAAAPSGGRKRKIDSDSGSKEESEDATQPPDAKRARGRIGAVSTSSRTTTPKKGDKDKDETVSKMSPSTRKEMEDLKANSKNLKNIGEDPLANALKKGPAPSKFGKSNPVLKKGGDKITWSDDDNDDDESEGERLPPIPEKRKFGTPKKSSPPKKHLTPNRPQSSGIGKKRVGWSPEETNALMDGIREYGVGNWAQILSNYAVLRLRTTVDLKDKWRNLQKLASKK